ncbi:MAG: DUF4097 family beta strand repeat-containing protein, partial [Fimbriimonadales bacterium]
EALRRAAAAGLWGRYHSEQSEALSAELAEFFQVPHVLLCASGTLAVEAVTGDVVADFETPVSGTVTIRTVNGDAKLSLPSGSDCRVALSTLRGSVVSEVDLNEQTKEGQRLTGRLGDGTGSVDVSAVNGDIVLRQRFVPPAEG